MRILFTNRYSALPLEIVQSLIPEGFEICFLPEQTQRALIEEAPRADYILAGGRLPITAEVLARAKKLKMIQRSGVGLDSIDLEALKNSGIPLYVNRGVNAESVAEHALLLILACLRRLPEIHENTVNGVWKKQEQGITTRELHGRTVGIVGMGNIARTLVRLLEPFGVKIVYCDVIRADEEFERAHGLLFLPLEEVLACAEILTLHCALTKETAGLIDRRSIAGMKEGAILVNTARGGLVNSEDLAEALKSGKIGYAGLDVHGNEPILPEDPLLHAPNVILTPHIGGVTADSFEAMMRGAMRNIEKFEKGELAEIENCRWQET